jgi:hypothetical protein
MTHYKSHPSGIEAIEITQYESFLRGNILKYVLRAPYKGTELEDLEKAAEYLQWEIERVKEDQFWAKFEERDKIEKDFVHTGNKVAKHLEEIGKMRGEWDEAKRDEYGTYYLKDAYDYYSAGVISGETFDQVVFPDKCQECDGNCEVC